MFNEKDIKMLVIAVLSLFALMIICNTITVITRQIIKVQNTCKLENLTLNSNFVYGGKNFSVEGLDYQKYDYLGDSFMLTAREVK